jgi:ferrochelatase
MKTGILVINFGEPDEPTLEKVTPFLERIFNQNGSLEDQNAEAALARSRQLARARAPGLVEEYEEIGGSPLNRQADAQAAALADYLRSAGRDVTTFSCYQFTDPLIDEGLERARAAGMERLVALPVYPLCGHSTNVAALDRVAEGLERMGWDVPWVGITGWHHHAGYVSLRVDNIRTFVEERGLDLQDPDTLLYFSAHGTPIKYLKMGSRYDRYVHEQCAEVARQLGAKRWTVGFQNHTNRRIAWTQPDNEDRLVEVREAKLVVEPISFMHEQSETLAELDHELREFVEDELGKEFHRVPVPHAHPRFVGVLADLVQKAAAAADGEEVAMLAPCRCRPRAGTFCTNGARDLPESPYMREKLGAS